MNWNDSSKGGSFFFVQTKMTASRKAGESSFFVSLRIVGFTEKIIDAGVIDAGKLDEDGDRYVGGTDFVLTVTCLRDIEHGSDLGLLPVVILAEIADTGVGNDLSHNSHLKHIINKLKWLIDK